MYIVSVVLSLRTHVLCRRRDKTRHAIYDLSPQFFSALEIFFFSFPATFSHITCNGSHPKCLCGTPVEDCGYRCWVRAHVLNLSDTLSYQIASVFRGSNLHMMRPLRYQVSISKYTTEILPCGVHGMRIGIPGMYDCIPVRLIIRWVSSLLMLIDAHAMYLPTPTSSIGHLTPHGHRFILQPPRFTNTWRM